MFTIVALSFERIESGFFLWRVGKLNSGASPRGFQGGGVKPPAPLAIFGKPKKKSVKNHP